MKNTKIKMKKTSYLITFLLLINIATAFLPTKPADFPSTPDFSVIIKPNNQINLATCNDNIQNQNEEDVDCGGPCDACRKSTGNLMIYGLIVLGVLIILTVVYILMKKKSQPSIITEIKK